jgi:hypothetical protein
MICFEVFIQATLHQGTQVVDSVDGCFLVSATHISPPEPDSP